MDRPLRLAFVSTIALALLGAAAATRAPVSVDGPRAPGASHPTVVADRLALPEQVDLYTGRADLFIRHPQFFSVAPDWPASPHPPAISPAGAALTPTDR
jgi:hypothetical protein